MASKKNLTPEMMEHIIARLAVYADAAEEELKKDPEDVFYQGKQLAYTEMFDVIEIELDAYGQDLKAYGLK